MDQRIIEFIRGLRAAGVRVSVAESQDALRATQSLGVMDKELFRESLRATLIKRREDYQPFQELFPLYFSSGDAPLQNAAEELAEDEMEMLRAALQGMTGRLDALLKWLTSGEGPTKEELEQMAQRAGMRWAQSPQDAYWVTRDMLKQMGYEQLGQKMQELIAKLREMGMSEAAISKLLGVVEANRDTLAQNVAQRIGLQIAQERAERPDELGGSDLMNKPFGSLTEAERGELRAELGRLINQLRTRAALRRRRGTAGKFDAKNTIRASQRYGGVPFELRFRKQKLKPSLVLLFDVSGSLQETVDFALRLLYELQDQVSKVRSFAFYADLAEVTDILARLDTAVDDIYPAVRRAVRGGAYQTDLGRGLEIFHEQHLASVSNRTTVIIMGDGCNSWNPPRVDLLDTLARRAKRLIWLNTEDPYARQEDSDMHLYAPLCSAVYPVRNLAQLATAVDKLLVD
jgi:uncharacterized protein